MASNNMQVLKDIANKLRIHSINSTDSAGTGHPTSCMSMAEIISVLFFNTMRYSIKEPRGPSNDRFVLSKGHAAPILYAAWAEAGLFPTEDLLNLRKLNSDLEGHPTPRLNFIDVATGSLGQGLSVAVGMAYTGKYFDQADYRVYCVIGDGESAEGSIWEAMAFGSHYKLDNMVAIFDVNRLGQSEETSLQHQIDVYKARAESFGWNTYVVDGHSVEDLCKAFHEASSVKGKPTCIVAKTYKGQGGSVADQLNWHGKPLGKESEASRNAIASKIVNKGPHGFQPPTPTTVPEVNISNITLSSPPVYEKNAKVATRHAYGTALVKLGKSNDRVVAMDGDTKNSTFAIDFKNAFPNRFIECFIAEQNLVGVGIGCGCRNRTVPFISTFACFLTRAFDQIRMGAISQTNANFVGSHCGVSIGEDGPSQMALEDIAMFRSIPGSTVFYPSDAVSCERAIEMAANTKGVCFIRTSRPPTSLLYDEHTDLQIGKAQVVRQSDNDCVTVIGCCVTLHQALKAADILASDGLNIRVIDPFTIKPMDKATIAENARATGGRIITVEDHYAWGGLGDAVCAAVSEYGEFAVHKMAVTEIPRSGPSDALLEKYGISASCIIKKVKEVCKA
ncbi:transketolase-like protein 2 isoform X2 [Pecten maximus]|uniref:transketolase-like protein 2 isoform X2 n=1 Tax=Pecten maximus TaxID=6579 RepID=UPI001458719F|nr:transketolase-like protein 2 isoform X2 [Pecten maximus]